MSTISMLPVQGPRVEDIEALKKAMPQLVQAAAKDVGSAGVKAFFDGYKSNVDEQKLAA